MRHPSLRKFIFLCLLFSFVFPGTALAAKTILPMGVMFRQDVLEVIQQAATGNSTSQKQLQVLQSIGLVTKKNAPQITQLNDMKFSGWDMGIGQFSTNGSEFSLVRSEVRIADKILHDFLLVWNSQTGDFKRLVTSDRLFTALALSPDSLIVAGEINDGNSRQPALMDTKTGKTYALPGESIKPIWAKFSADGRYVAMKGSKGLSIFTINNKFSCADCQVQYLKLQYEPHTYEFSHDGSHIVVAYMVEYLDEGTKLLFETWSVETGNKIKTLLKTELSSARISISHDDSLILLVSGDHKFIVDATTGKILFESKDKNMGKQFLPNQNTLFKITANGAYITTRFGADWLTQSSEISFLAPTKTKLYHLLFSPTPGVAVLQLRDESKIFSWQIFNYEVPTQQSMAPQIGQVKKTKEAWGLFKAGFYAQGVTLYKELIKADPGTPIPKVLAVDSFPYNLLDDFKQLPLAYAGELILYQNKLLMGQTYAKFGYNWQADNLGEIHITQVLLDLPAEKYGLKIGDHILTINDHEITEEDLNDKFSRKLPLFETATFKLERDGQTINLLISPEQYFLHPMMIINGLYKYGYLAAYAGHAGLTLQAAESMAKLLKDYPKQFNTAKAKTLATTLKALSMAYQGKAEEAYDLMLAQGGLKAADNKWGRSNIIWYPDMFRPLLSNRAKMAYIMGVEGKDLPTPSNSRLVPQPYPDLTGKLIQPARVAQQENSTPANPHDMPPGVEILE